MDFERATLHVLNGYPPNYLQDENVLFVEATNASAETLTTEQFHELLLRLEKERLVVSSVVQRKTKWKITGAGRAWLKE